MTLAELGNRIRRFRLWRRLTQTTLASLLRITRQAIAKYEAGHAALPAARVPQLCEALRITPNQLFGTPAMQLPNESAYDAMFADSVARHSVAARDTARSGERDGRGGACDESRGVASTGQLSWKGHIEGAGHA